MPASMVAAVETSAEEMTEGAMWGRSTHWGSASRKTWRAACTSAEIYRNVESFWAVLTISSLLAVFFCFVSQVEIDVRGRRMRIGRCGGIGRRSAQPEFDGHACGSVRIGGATVRGGKRKNKKKRYEANPASQGGNGLLGGNKSRVQLHEVNSSGHTRGERAKEKEDRDGSQGLGFMSA